MSTPDDEYPPEVQKTGEWRGKLYWRMKAINGCTGCMFREEQLSPESTPECRAFRHQGSGCFGSVMIRPEQYDDYRIAAVTHALFDDPDECPF